MPHFRLETNVPQDEIPADFPQKLCGIIAKSLEKPKDYCVATVIGGVNMSWGGTTVPAGQAVLISMGSLGVKENKKHAAALFEVIEKDLGIRRDKLYIHFQNVPTSDLGFNGTTFHEGFGG